MRTDGLDLPQIRLKPGSGKTRPNKTKSRPFNYSSKFASTIRQNNQKVSLTNYFTLHLLTTGVRMTWNLKNAKDTSIDHDQKNHRDGLFPPRIPECRENFFCFGGNRWRFLSRHPRR